MNFNLILQLVAAFIIIFFSIFVFIKNKKNIHFSIFGISIFIWLVASFLAYISQIESWILFWFKISYIGIIFIPSTFFSFVSYLLGRRPNKIISLTYFISFFFTFLLFFSKYL